MSRFKALLEDEPVAQRVNREVKLARDEGGRRLLQGVSFAFQRFWGPGEDGLAEPGSVATPEEMQARIDDLTPAGYVDLRDCHYEAMAFLVGRGMVEDLLPYETVPPYEVTVVLDGEGAPVSATCGTVLATEWELLP